MSILKLARQADSDISIIAFKPNNAFILKKSIYIMNFEEKVAESFKKAREDAEGIKNELAFALKRVAKIEEALTRQAIKEAITKNIKNSKKKR